jgi:ParB-like chromosome segregation protein Spo0J
MTESDDGAIGALDTAELDQATGPAAVLAQLKAQAAAGSPKARPSRVPLADIREYPDVFQPRGHDVVEQHVETLVRVIRTQGALEPIKVAQIGDEVVVIDGHHRVAAYSRANATSDVPVVFFEGTLEDAVLEAGRSNSQAKLQMDNQERQDFAWRLVRMGYKKREIIAAAGVSDGQVAIMRRVLKKLDTTADDYPRWFRAHKAAHGKDDPPMPDHEREAWVEAQAQLFADKLSKAFGKKLAGNIEIAAHALAIHFGRRLPELMQDLMQHADLPEADDEDDF